MVDKDILIDTLKHCTSDKPYSCIECPYVSYKSLSKANKCVLIFLNDCLEYLKNNGKEEKPSWSNIDIYVRDRQYGDVHRVGDDQHDSLWVDSNGTVHFHNLQNGDGCGANSLLEDEEECSYEFCPSMYGKIDRDYVEKHKEDCEEYIKKWIDENG